MRLWSVLALAAVLVVACGERQPAKPVVAPEKKPKKLPALLRAIPDTTVFALALTDLDKWRADLKETELNAMWEDPRLQVWREQGWPKVKAYIAQVTGVSLDEINSILHGDLVLTAGATADGSEPRVALMVRPTSNKAQLEAFVQKMMARLPPGGPTTRWVDDVLVIAQDAAFAGVLEANLKADHAPLEGHKGYDVLRREYDADAFVHVWLDCSRVVELVLSTMPESVRAERKPALDELGVSNLTALYISSAIRQKAFHSRVWLKFDGPRKGLFSFVGDNAPSRAIRLVPETAQSFMSVRHASIKQIIDAVHAIARTTPGFTEESWTMNMNAANANLGIDIENDLPQLIGEEFAVAFFQAAPPVPGVCFYIESHQPDGLIAQIDKALAQTPLPKQPGNYKETAYQMLTFPQIPLLPIQVCYGRVGDFVVVSIQQAGFHAVVDALKSGRSLADDATYRDTVAKAGQPGWLVSFSRAIESASLGMMMPLLVQQLNRAMGTNLAAADIPNPSVLFDHLGASAGCGRTYIDAIEVKGYSLTGLPINLHGAPLLGMGIAVAVPGFMRAREVSRATSCQINLIKMEGSVDQWAVEYDKEDGDTVTLGELVGPTLYLKRTPRCPGGGNYPQTLTVGKTPTCDYIPPAWFDTQRGKYKHMVPDAVD